MSYQTIKTNVYQILNLASLTADEFKPLIPLFEAT